MQRTHFNPCHTYIGTGHVPWTIVRVFQAWWIWCFIIKPPWLNLKKVWLQDEKTFWLLRYGTCTNVWRHPCCKRSTNGHTCITLVYLVFDRTRRWTLPPCHQASSLWSRFHPWYRPTWRVAQGTTFAGKCWRPSQWSRSFWARSSMEFLQSFQWVFFSVSVASSLLELRAVTFTSVSLSTRDRVVYFGFASCWSRM